MCIIFFYVNANPAPNGYKLILASNRDEFFVRKTQKAHKWRNGYVYGGIDMEPGREGGTWLAIGGKGGTVKLGALLNLTGEEKQSNAVGRGKLATDFVSSFEEQHNISNFNKALKKDCTKYNGFNFTSIEIGQEARVAVCSNVPPRLEFFEQEQYYAFSNSLPAKPFQKVCYGKSRFQRIVENFHMQISADTCVGTEQRLLLKAELINLLKCDMKCWPDAELKKRAPDWGEYLSAINVYIPHAAYGSRTHTVILLDANDCLHYYESTLNGDNPLEDEWQDTYLQEANFSQNKTI